MDQPQPSSDQNMRYVEDGDIHKHEATVQPSSDALDAAHAATAAPVLSDAETAAVKQLNDEMERYHKAEEKLARRMKSLDDREKHMDALQKEFDRRKVCLSCHISLSQLLAMRSNGLMHKIVMTVSCMIVAMFALVGLRMGRTATEEEQGDGEAPP